MTEINEKLTVSVVIPNYNGEGLLRKNLGYLIKAYKRKENCIEEIILVDDASQDSSVEFAKRNFPEIKLIKHKINRGFACTSNTGVRSAKSKLICLLNNDVIVQDNFLEAALHHFRNNQIFGVSLHERGYGWAKAKFESGFINHKGMKASDDVENTFWISGGSGVFRKSYWLKLGGFDDKLFKFYWEDIDLSYRALKRGYKLVWEPKAKVIHEHESTTSKTFSKTKLTRMQEINQLVFIWKNLTSANLFRKHLVGLFSRISRHPGNLIIFLGALTKTRKIIRARKREKKETSVSDEAIFVKFSGN